MLSAHWYVIDVCYVVDASVAWVRYGCSGSKIFRTLGNFMLSHPGHMRILLQQAAELLIQIIASVLTCLPQRIQHLMQPFTQFQDVHRSVPTLFCRRSEEQTASLLL